MWWHEINRPIQFFDCFNRGRKPSKLENMYRPINSDKGSNPAGHSHPNITISLCSNRSIFCYRRLSRVVKQFSNQLLTGRLQNGPHHNGDQTNHNQPHNNRKPRFHVNQNPRSVTKSVSCLSEDRSTPAKSATISQTISQTRSLSSGRNSSVTLFKSTQ